MMGLEKQAPGFLLEERMVEETWLDIKKEIVQVATQTSFGLVFSKTCEIV
jgi:hypothetical protein